LNQYLFRNLEEARDMIEAWRNEYNQSRPHSALGYLTPAEYGASLV
jgi:putative transposase